jgi:hypothetical protein
MTKNFEVENLTNALTDIILPKFNKYVEDRKNDISLHEQIDAIVDQIDDYELLVNDLVENLETDFKDNISIAGYWFKYSPELDTYIYDGEKLSNARYKVWNKEGLNNWDMSRNIIRRITAIVTTLEPTSFDEVVKIVESKIDFNEFIVKQ